MPQCACPEPLSAVQLRRLEEHKYSAAGRSLLEPPCQIYWNWLVQQIPTWVAPNTLTIIGLLINILTTVILVYYSPSATEEVSSVASGTLSDSVTCFVLFKCPASLVLKINIHISSLIAFGGAEQRL